MTSHIDTVLTLVTMAANFGDSPQHVTLKMNYISGQTLMCPMIEGGADGVNDRSNKAVNL